MLTACTIQSALSIDYLYDHWWIAGPSITAAFSRINTHPLDPSLLHAGSTTLENWFESFLPLDPVATSTISHYLGKPAASYITVEPSQFRLKSVKRLDPPNASGAAADDDDTAVAASADGTDDYTHRSKGTSGAFVGSSGGALLTEDYSYSNQYFNSVNDDDDTNAGSAFHYEGDLDAVHPVSSLAFQQQQQRKRVKPVSKPTAELRDPIPTVEHEGLGRSVTALASLYDGTLIACIGQGEVVMWEGFDRPAFTPNFVSLRAEESANRIPEELAVALGVNIGASAAATASFTSSSSSSSSSSAFATADTSGSGSSGGSSRRNKARTRPIPLAFPLQMVRMPQRIEPGGGFLRSDMASDASGRDPFGGVGISASGGGAGGMSGGADYTMMEVVDDMRCVCALDPIRLFGGSSSSNNSNSSQFFTSGGYGGRGYGDDEACDNDEDGYGYDIWGGAGPIPAGGAGGGFDSWQAASDRIALLSTRRYTAEQRYRGRVGKGKKVEIEATARNRGERLLFATGSGLGRIRVRVVYSHTHSECLDRIYCLTFVRITDHSLIHLCHQFIHHPPRLYRSMTCQLDAWRSS